VAAAAAAGAAAPSTERAAARPWIFVLDFYQRRWGWGPRLGGVWMRTREESFFAGGLRGALWAAGSRPAREGLRATGPGLVLGWGPFFLS
jgi:hypothetical protein